MTSTILHIARVEALLHESTGVMVGWSRTRRDVTSTLVLFAGSGDAGHAPLRDDRPQLVGDVRDLFGRAHGRWTLPEPRVSHAFMSKDTVLGAPER